MKLIKHLTGYMPVTLANGLVGFGGVYVFTRLLGGADYGRYALMFSTLALIHTLSLTWAEAAGYRFAGKSAEEGDLPDHYRTGLSLVGRSLALAGLGTLVLWLFFRSDPSYARIIPWLLGVMIVNTIGQLALEAHRAHQRVARYSLTETVRILISFAAGAGIAWLGGFGAAAPFIGLMIGGGLIVLWEGPWLLKQARGGQRDAGRTRAWLFYGVPIAAALALDILLSVADRFLINYYLDEVAVGAYAAGYGVADKPVLMICAWAALGASPLVMAAYESEGKAAAGEAARGLIGAILLLGLPAAVGIALVAEPLANVAVSEDLRVQAAQIMPYIAFAGLLNGLLIHYVSESFQLVRRTDQRALLMIVPVVANIVMNIVMLPMFGLMGAVYATVASYAIGVGLLGIVGRRLVPLPLPVGEVAKVVVASLAMWPVIHFVPDLGGWGELFAKTIAGGVVYVIVALVLDAGGARQLLQDRLGRKEPTAS